MFLLLLFLLWVLFLIFSLPFFKPIYVHSQWGKVSSLELFSLDSQGSATSLGTLDPNSQVDLSQFPSITIVANIHVFDNSQINRVEFYVNSTLYQTQNSAPYCIASDNGDGTVYYQWIVSPSTYAINVIPYNQNDNKGISRTTLLTVFDSKNSPSVDQISSQQQSISQQSSQSQSDSNQPISTENQQGITSVSQSLAITVNSEGMGTDPSSITTNSGDFTLIPITPNILVNSEQSHSIIKSIAFLVSVPVGGCLLVSFAIIAAVLLLRKRTFKENSMSVQTNYSGMRRTSYVSEDIIRTQVGNTSKYSPTNTQWQEIIA